MRQTGRAAIPGALAGLAVAVALAASGGTAYAKSHTPSTAGRPQAASRAPLPGASGQVAAVSGSTLEVQNPSSGQVTVTLTPQTVITQTVQTTPGALTVGVCASAVGTRPATASSSKSSAAGRASSAAQRFTARTVLITAPASTGCSRTGVEAAGPFGRGSFLGRSSGAGKGARPKRAGRFVAVYGEVTAASTSSCTLRTPTGPATVRFTSATRFDEVVAATAASVALGDCVSAVGPANQTGAITARALAIRPTGPDGCFGRFSGPPGAPPGRVASAPTKATSA